MNNMTVKKSPQQPWPDFPIPDDWIQKGQPSGKGMILVENKKEGTCIGLWECSSGTYKWDYDSEEYIHLLTGEVTITETGGDTYTLKAGDSAHFPKGSQTVWEIIKPIRKVFFGHTQTIK